MSMACHRQDICRLFIVYYRVVSASLKHVKERSQQICWQLQSIPEQYEVLHSSYGWELVGQWSSRTLVTSASVSLIPRTSLQFLSKGVQTFEGDAYPSSKARLSVRDKIPIGHISHVFHVAALNGANWVGDIRHIALNQVFPSPWSCTHPHFRFREVGWEFPSNR